MLWWLLGIGVALANDPDPFLAADLGMGGAVRANPSAFGASLSAPAIVALSPRYSLGMGGRIGSSSVRRVDAGAIDSTTGPLALGAVFVRESLVRDATTDELPGWLEDASDLVNPQTHTSVGGGVAMSWLNRRISVGAGARYWQYASRFVEREQTVQAHASVAGRLGEGVYLSLSGENLLPGGWDLAQPAIGTALRLEKASVAAWGVDLVTGLGEDAGLSALHTGAEVWVGEFVPVRFGYQRAFQTQQNTWSGGVGVGAEQAILEYGMNIQPDTSSHTHALSLRIFL